ncbi:MAG: phosphoenolpyruvate carboxykinase (ATP), partial [Lentisphaeria bacterium]
MTITATKAPDHNAMLTDNVSVYIQQLGISYVDDIIYNPSYQELLAAETDAGLGGWEKGTVTESGAVNVDTGKYTGRSPKDKYIVLDDTTRDTIWWRSATAKNDNKAIAQDVWNELKATVTQ